MEIYGKRLPVLDLRRRVGNMDQIAGVRCVTLDDGNERPARAAIVHSGSGLEFTVLLDRGMDVPAASFCGKAMGWRSTTGDVAPMYFEPEGIRWLRSYFGGLVTTCGLINVGAPAPGLRSAVSGEGLHGRIGHTPARNVKIEQDWVGDDYVIRITGTMRETVVFGENLTLTRTVATKLGARSFTIHDVVKNDGFKTTPFMLLYHCNIGWPAVDDGATLISPSRNVAPRDPVAADGKERWWKMDAPTHGYAEKCYYHDMTPSRDGTVTTAIVNDGFKKGDGFGVYIKYRKDELPRFVQWKMMGEQDYVCGLEPANCGVEGKHIDRELGLQHELQSGEQREFHLEFGAITSEEEVKRLQSARDKVKTTLVKSYKDFVRPAK